MCFVFFAQTIDPYGLPYRHHFFTFASKRGQLVSPLYSGATRPRPTLLLTLP
jgi:hypothetical protein